MDITPYLYYDGDCEQAFRLYEKVLGGQVVAMLRYSDAPSDQPVSAGTTNRIMHARLVHRGRQLMGSDTPEGMFKTPQSFSVALSIETPDEAERIFAGLADGGQVMHALRETFFAHRFGMLVDRFGIPWIVNCEKAEQRS